MKGILFLVVGFLFFPVSERPDNWVLRKDKDGVKVYTRDKEGSKLKELKIVTDCPGTLSECVSLLYDKDHLKDWVYGCVESSLLKRVSDKEMYHYQRTEAPWPVDDRDVIVHSIMNQDPTTKEITISSTCKPDYLDKKKDVVRVRDYTAVWSFAPSTNNTIHLTYYLSVDPGGALPAWIVNMAVDDGPIKTIDAMKKKLKDYKGKKLSFISE